MNNDKFSKVKMITIYITTDAMLPNERTLQTLKFKKRKKFWKKKRRKCLGGNIKEKYEYEYI